MESIKELVIEGLNTLKIEIDKYRFNFSNPNDKIEKIDKIINDFQEENMLIKMDL